MHRIRELDAIRGLAAVAIVTYHFRAGWLPFGWGAVDLFFVLSGFLITSIILHDGTSRGFLARFYIRRGLRIWPIYYLCLAAIVLAGPILPRPNNYAGFLNYLTYTQFTAHYWGGVVQDFSWYLKHTWTLAIEEQFYLFWPPLVLLVGRRGLPWLAAAVAGAAIVARSKGMHWWVLAGRCDGFALGGLLAWVLMDAQRVQRYFRPIRNILAVVGTASFFYLLRLQLREGLPDHGPPLRPASTIVAMNLMFTALIGLVVTHSGRPALALLRGPVLGYLGTISYGLYLYHMVVIRVKMDIAARLELGRTPLLDLLLVALSVALAAASWHFVEQPILRLKSRFDYDSAPRSRRASAPLPRLDAPHVAGTSRRAIPNGTMTTRSGQ